MLKNGISASMMCVDFADTKKDLQALCDAGIEYLHFDIMDGTFVPNYALGPCMINSLRSATQIPFDIHLMVDHPEQKLAFFQLQAGDVVSIHVESTAHLQRILANLKEKGIITGVVLNPATPIVTLEYVLDMIDFVLVMTVNPGYAGQSLVEVTIQKITDLRKYLDDHNKSEISIQVDGNVSFENAKRMKKAGANNFVAGTAGLFRKDMSISEAGAQLKKCIQ
ncbi:MAG: ribulose-phosphate 3-epimerase [Vallitaleaceae bacterium]|nr:ribulose-phosphate 3-epimerase [Vallitaleaceae bacterium]